VFESKQELKKKLPIAIVVLILCARYQWTFSWPHKKGTSYGDTTFF